LAEGGPPGWQLPFNPGAPPPSDEEEDDPRPDEDENPEPDVDAPEDGAMQRVPGTDGKTYRE
ncbi:MAG: hypothetical protein ACXWLG_01485, partial [Myxococcaceae bacterium]